ncbi:MAG: hypothetical protein Q8Q42_03110 [Nanoarchaeota archaeon]|nr:hypothetical protein [Nanoarchaeota archaeon]
MEKMEQNNNSVRETSGLEEMFRQTLSEEEIAKVDRAGKNLARFNRIGLLLPFVGAVASALPMGSAIISGYLGGYVEAGNFIKETPEYIENLFYFGMMPLFGGSAASALLFPFNIPNYRNVKSYLSKYDTFVRNCELPNYGEENGL